MNSQEFVNYFGLQPADKIIVPKSLFDLVQHHALYLGQDEHYRHLISENVVNIGVQVITLEDFLNNNRKITRVEKYQGTWYQRQQVVKNALSKVGKPYNIITFNCEHYTNEARTGKKSSPQLAVGGAILGIIGLIIGIRALSKNS